MASSAFVFLRLAVKFGFVFDEFLLEGEEKGLFLECTLSVILCTFNFWHFDITMLWKNFLS